MHRISLVFLSAVLILSGCGSTKNTNFAASMIREGLQPQKYQRLAIVAMSPILNNRAIVEQDLAIAFSEKGVKAIPTYNIFPFAANQQVVREVYDDPEKLEAFVRKRIYDNNIDALLILSVFDVEQETRYVGGSSVSVGVSAPGYYAGSPYIDPNVPTYGYSYMGYYGYAYATVYGNDGYYKTTSTYFVESNLYDVAAENLIWTGQTVTKVPESINLQSQEFASTIVNEIIKVGAIKP